MAQRVARRHDGNRLSSGPPRADTVSTAHDGVPGHPSARRSLRSGGGDGTDPPAGRVCWAGGEEESVRRDALIDPLQVLRRSWRLLLLCTVAGTVLLALGADLLPKHYTSAAVVRVLQQQQGGSTGVVPAGGEESARVVATQRDLVLSDQVVAAVASRLGRTADDVRASTTVAADATADSLTITSTGSSATAAQALAAQVSNTYVDQTTAVGRQALQRQLDVKAQAAAAAQAQTLEPSIPPYLKFAAGQRYTGLLAEQNTLTQQRDSYTGIAAVVSSARLPASPSSLGAKTAATAGFVLGLIAGMGLALLLATRRDRLTWVSDMVQAGGLPLLAEVPFARSLAREPARVRLQPVVERPVVEAIRGLAVTATADGRQHTLLVTSTGRYDGKTTVAAQLAVAAARSGLRTTLVVADTRDDAVLEEVPPGAVGLTDLLDRVGHPTTSAGGEGIDATLLASALRDSGHAQLRVLGVGTRPSLGPDLLRGPRLPLVLAALARDADLVVIDAPAVSAPETMTLAAAVDTVMLCVGTHDAHRSVIRDSVAGLRAVARSVAGLVVVDVEDRVRPEHSDYESAPKPDAVDAAHVDAAHVDAGGGGSREPARPAAPAAPAAPVTPPTPPTPPTAGTAGTAAAPDSGLDLLTSAPEDVTRPAPAPPPPPDAAPEQHQEADGAPDGDGAERTPVHVQLRP